MFYVYLLKSALKTEQLYIGYTTDLKKRFEKHNKGLVKSTKLYLPWELISYEAYKNRKDAKRREKYLKTTKGRKIIKLMLKYSLNRPIG